MKLSEKVCALYRSFSNLNIICIPFSSSLVCKSPYYWVSPSSSFRRGGAECSCSGITPEGLHHTCNSNVDAININSITFLTFCLHVVWIHCKAGLGLRMRQIFLLCPCCMLSYYHGCYTASQSHWSTHICCMAIIQDVINQCCLTFLCWNMQWLRSQWCCLQHVEAYAASVCLLTCQDSFF